MSQVIKTSKKKSTSTTPVAKVVVRAVLRAKKPAPLTAEGRARLKAAARQPTTRVAPELPEWRTK
ncbi:hypothetical protein KTD33_30560 [Burkholderia gladioli]|uniref:hypothetical protein n=1 Tax=Burkholderia gladioli TaxID=28095 RepID=UPI001C24CDF6|nr:hypothetical protein [Burkholderia gladioli]MBU9198870.1 hypothetical protein [Burkholderia gladioli]